MRRHYLVFKEREVPFLHIHFSLNAVRRPILPLPQNEIITRTTVVIIHRILNCFLFGDYWFSTFSFEKSPHSSVKQISHKQAVTAL